jgi:hypothetical protein
MRQRRNDGKCEKPQIGLQKTQRSYSDAWAEAITEKQRLCVGEGIWQCKLEQEFLEKHNLVSIWTTSVNISVKLNFFKSR